MGSLYIDTGYLLGELARALWWYPLLIVVAAAAAARDRL
jgi:hypothetical protein